jgi:hypothetical protein
MKISTNSLQKAVFHSYFFIEVVVFCVATMQLGTLV